MGSYFIVLLKNFDPNLVKTRRTLALSVGLETQNLHIKIYKYMFSLKNFLPQTTFKHLFSSTS